ncbi:hypothetical protein SDC9_172459 [bioreactor metagenome]|uniref:Uncharacterized protein n=1 Tax=bioreactor metagenome TaxID=1076179 RepID=A0A645GG70_9ZZZZ
MKLTVGLHLWKIDSLKELFTVGDGHFRIETHDIFRQKVNGLR